MLVVGSSGHAKVIIDIVEKEEKFNIVGLLDAFKEIQTSEYDTQI
ncbi:MAG: hypothetical protein U9R02_12120 [Thermodesulfobacteriota bacterium]|nr:hypothetical protein [Thermodesulfobacteriota bacterium]